MRYCGLFLMYLECLSVWSPWILSIMTSPQFIFLPPWLYYFRGILNNPLAFSRVAAALGSYIFIRLSTSLVLWDLVFHELPIFLSDYYSTFSSDSSLHISQNIFLWHKWGHITLLLKLFQQFSFALRSTRSWIIWVLCYFSELILYDLSLYSWWHT